MLGKGAQVGAAILRHQFDHAVSLDLMQEAERRALLNGILMSNPAQD